METLEFWPEHEGGPLWRSDGSSIDLDSLRLPGDLRQRLAEWNKKYEDSLLPFEGNDLGWLSNGRDLLAELRATLANDFEIVVTEPWWDDSSAT